MRRLSIKWRVTLWYTGLFAVLSALVLLFVYANSTRMTAASIRRGLVHAVVEAADEIRYEGGALEVDEGVEGFDGVSILIYGRDGELVYGRRPSGFAAPIGPDVVQTVETGGYQWYVYDLPVEVEGYGDVLVRGIASSAAARIAGSSILHQALVIFPFLVLAAGAGGYLITRRAFLPVKRITDTAASISGGGDLSKRLAMQGVRDEIYLLAKTFDDMFTRLEQAFLNEKRFTADASHELRTPAAVIISQCEYALSAAAGEADREEALRTVLEQAGKMSALISQLLSLARMDAGRQQIELEEVDLGFALQSIAEELENEAQCRQITIHTDAGEGLLAYADHTLITRMLLNLVSNAVRYGRPGGGVWISVRREGKELVCDIRDDGAGIAPEHLQHIWERFYRVDQTREGQGGFGLGLPMARWIARAHGGEIQVQSVCGEGSLFTVRLPASDCENFADGS